MDPDPGSRRCICRVLRHGDYLDQKNPPRAAHTSEHTAAHRILCPGIVCRVLARQSRNPARRPWSVIKSFLDNLFAGKYPYDAISFMGNSPGPFPFYYVIALPFYLVNEIGLLTLAAIVAFCAFLNRRTADNSVFFMQTILLVASPALAWEIIARSTIFFNFSLVILYAFWLEKGVLCKSPNTRCFPALSAVWFCPPVELLQFPLFVTFPMLFFGRRTWQVSSGSACQLHAGFA